ncbi:unnamed protein product, partial [Lepidochelys kempii]
MAGNILTVVLVVADPHLQTPMYFFLGNLSCLETCYTSNILPRMLASLQTGDFYINTLRGMTKVFSVFYTILTPLVNPLIYSLRNKEVKEALRKVVRKLGTFTAVQRIQ